MNKGRRKQITKIIEQLEASKDDIVVVLDEEQASFDNMPENLLESERAELSQNAIDLLESAIDNLEEAVNNLEEAKEN